MAEQNSDFKSISEINEAMKRACCSPDIFFLREKIDQFEELQKEYNGREILELLQNADDAYSEFLKETQGDRQKVKVLVEYNGEHLVICNKGKPFDLNRVHVLCQGGFSNKEKVIGCKGKGFRSLLNFSDNITIYSGELSFRFSREFADIQEMTIADNSRVKAALKKGRKYPILFAPEDLSSLPFDKKGWDTIIDIKIFNDSNIRENIENQLDTFNAVSLLFLPNISSVEIKKIDDTIVYEKSSEGDDNVTHQFYVKKSLNGNPVPKESRLYYFFEEINYVKKDGLRWSVVPEDGDDVKLLHNAIAIPERSKNFNDTEGKLFSYFPIRKEYSPFYATLHSTFELDQYRDNLIAKNNDNDLNIFVSKKLLAFYVETIKKYFAKKEFGNYATELLTPIDFYESAIPGVAAVIKHKSFLTEYKLQRYYTSLIHEADMLLCSIDGSMLSMNDAPKYISGNEKLPQCLISESTSPELKKIVEFDNSIAHSKNVLPFAKVVLKLTNYDEKLLIKSVRKTARPMASIERAKVTQWWSKNFKNSVHELGVLKDNEGKFIEDNTKCFFTATIKGTPGWANICIISKEDEESLLSVFNVEIQERKHEEPNPKRILKDILCISDQSNPDQVVEDVNKSVTNRTQSIEFVQWLYKFFNDGKIQNTTREKIKKMDNLIFPTKTSFQSIDLIYLGSDYGNILGDAICPNLGLAPIAKYTDFINEDFSWEMEEALDFFTDLNIVKLPKLTSCEITAEHNKYLKTIKTEGIHNFGSWNTKLSKIRQVKTIYRLQTNPLKTEDVIRWFFNNSDIKNAVFEEFTKSELVYNLHRSSGIKTRNYSEKIPSFMHWFFRTTPWLFVKGGLRCPENCVLDDIKEENWFQEISEEYPSADIEPLLKKLGVVSDLISSKAADFYKKIIEMSTSKNKAESAKLYRKIADPANNDSLKGIVDYTGPEYKEFERNGLVWASNREGKEEFHKATDTYYTSSAVLNFSNKFIMKTPSRQGKADIFTKIFCVKEFKEEKIEVISAEDADERNTSFEADLRDFIPYFLICRSNINESIISDFRNLTIRLVKKIKLKTFIDEGEPQKELIIDTLNPYTVVKQSPSNWLIYIVESKYDKIKTADALKTILYVVLKSPAADLLNLCDTFFPLGKDYCKKQIEEKGYTIGEVEQIAQKINSRNDYVEKIKTAYPDVNCDDEMVKLIRRIDFGQQRNNRNSRQLVELAKKLGKDIPEIAEAIGVELSISNYNKDKLQILLETNENRIIYFIVEYLKDKSIEERVSIEEHQKSLEQWANSFEAPNTISFDPKEELKRHLATYNFDESTLCPSMTDIYASNKTQLLERYNDGDVNISFDSSLLYYNIDWNIEEDPIIQELKKLLFDLKVSEQPPKQEEVKRMEGVEFKTDDIPPSSYVYKGGSGRGSGAYSGKSERVGQANGDLAEYEVYNWIVEKKIKNVLDALGDYSADDDHIKWRSGAAHRLKQLKANDSLGYDMEVYGNEGDKVLYIEVKSSVGQECSFFMSENERLAAEKHQENYAIIFVGGVSTDHKTIRFIGNPLITSSSETEEGKAKGKFIFTSLKYHVDYKIGEE